MSDGKIELKPNLWAGAVQLIFDNYVNQRAEFTKKDLPHEFLIYGLTGLAFIGYFGVNLLTPYRAPFYTPFLFPPIAFVLQMYFLHGELKHRSYLIHENSVEIQDEFLDKGSISARFENITDVRLERPFIQRLFGTGNVRLYTAGKGAESELVIRYLDNSEEFYEEISEIINSREYNQELY